MSLRDPYRVVAGDRYPLPFATIEDTLHYFSLSLKARLNFLEIGPYDQSRASNDGIDISKIVETGVDQILRNSGISFTSFSVLSLWPKFNLAKKRDHLLLYTNNEDYDNWYDAANAIQSLLDQQIALSNKQDYRLWVEIRNYKLMLKDTSSAVRRGTIACEVLKMTQDLVMQSVEILFPNQFTSVSWVLRGAADNFNHRTPTVLITVEPRSSQLWDSHEESIRSAISDIDGINNYECDIDVRIVAGSNMLLNDWAMPPAKYHDCPGPEADSGVSIGPRCTSPASGTLGVWVNLLPAGKTLKTEAVVCFLTCHHVITAGDPTNAQANNAYGIALDGRSALKKIPIDFPSTIDSRWTIQTLQKRIQSPEVINRIQTIQNRLDAGGIGYVRHSSGLSRRTQTRGKLDWALIEVTDQTCVGKNFPALRSKLTPEHFASFLGDRFINEDVYFDIPGQIIDTVGTLSEETVMKPMSWVAKQGRTSRITTGDLNELWSGVKWDDGTTSWEHQIFPLIGGETFARPGDSGSLVHNVDKEWIGMMHCANTADDWGCFTSAQDIIDDIKLKTGGTITLLG
ncbi:hypothetical protein MBM_01286 [Drepanopeziza brunnea f. sp. 'multigermtubi' MB_m1]|uniref:Uncharacterized protein n=1 Tax=Marssonina brunnea f. sp. multigermtubi (strain MB_m1) TaxID=1072389 RepID=K1Y5Z2_MARBU|nr:uncharacterized protein MBM_01286 [Drepanopeziza brunnea f. sp. 'multigermtubi' MB_m1]EKD20604.1 hypothetical protein MBM_01286 [Drepanopeziza brunnea f. sp. 'multigermtubi' MB_m1]